MGVMKTALRLAFPRGEAWGFVSREPLFYALGDILESVRTSARQIVTESRPGTATDTLPEWHATLGQKYDATRPITEQRNRLEAVRLSVGGMTQYQLQKQIAREFPAIIVSEVSATSECFVDECGVEYCRGVSGDYSPIYYDVSGTLTDDTEALRVGAILDHYAPSHLIPCTALVIAGLTATSESGISLCGIEEAGSTGI